MVSLWYIDYWVRNMTSPSDNKTDEQWSALIESQPKSGLSVTEFCKQHAVNRTEFTRRKDQMAQLSLQQAVKNFIKVDTSSFQQSATPKSLEPADNALFLTIGQAQLEFSELTSPQWIARLIKEVNV